MFETRLSTTLFCCSSWAFKALALSCKILDQLIVSQNTAQLYQQNNFILLLHPCSRQFNSLPIWLKKWDHLNMRTSQVVGVCGGLMKEVAIGLLTYYTENKMIKILWPILCSQKFDSMLFSQMQIKLSCRQNVQGWGFLFSSIKNPLIICLNEMKKRKEKEKRRVMPPEKDITA